MGILKNLIKLLKKLIINKSNTKLIGEYSLISFKDNKID